MTAKYFTAKVLAEHAAAKSAAAVTKLDGAWTSACYYVAKADEADKAAVAMAATEGLATPCGAICEQPNSDSELGSSSSDRERSDSSSAADSGASYLESLHGRQEAEDCLR